MRRAFHGKFGGTLFVNDLKQHGGAPDLGLSCHLFTLPGWEDDLHEFADKIGLLRAWFQETTMPHYDLTPSLRARAIRTGAVAVGRKEAVEIIRQWRAERARLRQVALRAQLAESEGSMRQSRPRTADCLSEAEVLAGFAEARSRIFSLSRPPVAATSKRPKL